MGRDVARSRCGRGAVRGASLGTAGAGAAAVLTDAVAADAMTSETVFVARVSMLAALARTDAGVPARAAETMEELAVISCEASPCASVMAAPASCSAWSVLNGSERAVAGTARTPHAITATRAQMRTQP